MQFFPGFTYFGLDLGSSDLEFVSYVNTFSSRISRYVSDSKESTVATFSGFLMQTVPHDWIPLGCPR